MTCTIIIPTYNNARVLPYTLRAVMDQEIQPQVPLDILICDDGSEDETTEIARRWAKKGPYTLNVLEGEHGGAAHARNQGLAATTSDIVLFLGADIVVRPGALQEHLIFHQQHAEETAGALGVLRWDPRLHPTPFMEWMIHGGSQNDYDALVGKEIADPKHFFYCGFISLKRSFLKNNLFSTNFAQYGWEDLELGRRLASRGLKLYVLPQAKALHRHFYTVHDIAKRQYAIGHGLVEYQGLYPHEKLLPASTSGKKILRLLVIHTGGIKLLQYLIYRVNKGGLSMPSLFLAYISLELWRGILKRVKLFPL